jgi:hypothetical protein
MDRIGLRPPLPQGRTTVQHRNRTGTGIVLLVATLTGITSAADAPKDASKSKSYSDPRELRVSPSSAPVPALKYRLIPLESERTPGNAAPIYLRLGVRASTEAKREFGQKYADWINLPLEQFPLADAKKYVEKWASYFEQLKFGAWKQTCDWNYTLPEQKEEVIEVVLPDAQDMRNWSRLQALKARVEIAERKYDEAVRTIETGISFGRHTGDGPFVINSLVGVACAQVMLSGVEELIVQPDAPNLYWALAALPRPLVGTRKALETEEVLPEWLYPELKEVGRPHTDAEWTLILNRLHDRMMATEKKVMVTDETGTHPAKTTFPERSAFKAKALPAAKAYLKERKVSTEKMPDDQVILVYLADRYREIYDDLFKYVYLPFPEAIARIDAAEKRLNAVKTVTFDPFVTLIPNLIAVLRTEARLDRSVAALRVIEALRMHAADRGALPQSLDQVTIVPIPLDPMTGKSFEYKLDGETATLVGPEVEPPLVLRYQITLRK